MKSFAPHFWSVFGSISSFVSPFSQDRTVHLHGKVHDLMSDQPIGVTVKVLLFYNGDLAEQCPVVNGEFTAMLNKEGCYMVSLTADGYMETIDTVWVLSTGQSFVEKTYFMSPSDPVIKIGVI
jgi:hypothetical protein